MLSNTPMIANKNRLFVIPVIFSILSLGRISEANSSPDLPSSSERKSQIGFHCFTPADMPFCFTNSRNKSSETSIVEYVSNLKYADNAGENQIEEIFGLNDTKEFKYKKGRYHIKDDNKTYVLPINSVVLCISVGQQETEMHLAKLMRINPIPMIKDKIFSICKNPDDLEIMKNYHNELKIARNMDKSKFIKEFFLKAFRQDTEYVEIDTLFKEIFNKLEKRFKFKNPNAKFKKITEEEKAVIEKSIRDIRNEYPYDLTSKKAAFMKSDFVKISTEYTKEMQDGRSVYSKFLRGKSNEQIKQGLYDVIKMYLELLKNKFILAENNLPHYSNKHSPCFMDFASFCWDTKEILRDYINDKPNEILPLIKEYIDEIRGLFRSIEKKEVISILENDPNLLLDENNLDKFFADERHRFNNSDYSSLKNTQEKRLKRKMYYRWRLLKNLKNTLDDKTLYKYYEIYHH